MKSQRTAAFVQKRQYGFAASPGRRLTREFAGTVVEASLRDCRKLCCKLCGCFRSWLARIATCILTDDRWRPFAYPTVSRTALQGKHEIALEAAASGSAAFFFRASAVYCISLDSTVFDECLLRPANFMLSHDQLLPSCPALCGEGWRPSAVHHKKSSTFLPELRIVPRYISGIIWLGCCIGMFRSPEVWVSPLCSSRIFSSVESGYFWLA